MTWLALGQNFIKSWQCLQRTPKVFLQRRCLPRRRWAMLYRFAKQPWRGWQSSQAGLLGLSSRCISPHIDSSILFNFFKSLECSRTYHTICLQMFVQMHIWYANMIEWLWDYQRHQRQEQHSSAEDVIPPPARASGLGFHGACVAGSCSSATLLGSTGGTNESLRRMFPFSCCLLVYTYGWYRLILNLKRIFYGDAYTILAVVFKCTGGFLDLIDFERLSGWEGRNKKKSYVPLQALEVRSSLCSFLNCLLHLFSSPQPSHRSTRLSRCSASTRRSALRRTSSAWAFGHRAEAAWPRWPRTLMPSPELLGKQLGFKLFSYSCFAQIVYIVCFS